MSVISFDEKRKRYLLYFFSLVSLRSTLGIGIETSFKKTLSMTKANYWLQKSD
jgi:hypothetical protein